MPEICAEMRKQRRVGDTYDGCGGGGARYETRYEGDAAEIRPRYARDMPRYARDTAEMHLREEESIIAHDNLEVEELHRAMAVRRGVRGEQGCHHLREDAVLLADHLIKFDCIKG